MAQVCRLSPIQFEFPKCFDTFSTIQLHKEYILSCRICLKDVSIFAVKKNNDARLGYQGGFVANDL